MTKQLLLFLFLPFVFFGCNSQKGDVSNDTKVQNKKSKEFPLKSKPNNHVYYDLDKNGKKDCTAIYDERGQLQKLEIDTNENGKVDRVIFYKFSPKSGQSVKVSEQYDDNEDGFLDAEKIFDGEKLISAWYDTDFNRKPDVWETMGAYEKISIKIDSDGDGIPDVGGDHIVSGNEKMGKKQYNEAYDEYKTALNYNSRSSMAYWGMALALESLHNYEMAIKHLERYILLKGPNAEQATRKINYLKNKLNQDFRSKPVK
jgi:tetratricopeptide (TPR) repeat protein